MNPPDSFIVREAGNGFFVTHRLGALIFAQGLQFPLALAITDQANAVLKACPQKSVLDVWEFIAAEN